MMHHKMLYGYRNTTSIVRDPITVGAAILGSLGVATSSVFLISAVGYIATSLVTSWALRALSPKPSLGRSNSAGILINAKDATASHEFVYGQVRKGGVVTYYETTPSNQNKFLHQIIVLAGHELHEIGDIYINDELVAFDGDFVTEKWKSKIRIQKFRGNQTSAPASLLDESNQINENFIGQGLAYLYVRYEYDQDVFSNGIPLITAVVKGKRVFDPRTNTTAYRNNAALCVRDYLTSAYGMNTTDVDDTAFSVAANVCDETITLDGGGTEPRYTMNGLVRSDQKHSDNLANMMTSCAGTLFWGGGKFILRSGAYTAPTKVLTLDDLRSQISIDTRTNMRDQFNYVQGTFNDADQRWITVDYPPFKSAAFLNQDNGEAIPLDLELPMTTSAASAQRIAKLTLFRGREQITITADFGLNALDVEVGEIVALTIDRYGWNEKEFEVVGWKFGPNQDAGDLRVSLSLRETSEAAFDWDGEESDIISNDTNLPSAFSGLDVANLTISGGGRTQGDGTFINSVILSWTAASSSFVDHYQIEYRPVSDSNFSSTTTVETSVEVSPIVDGIEYAFRVRAVSVTGVRGPFTSATFTGGGDVTAPGLPTSFSASGTLGFINLSWVSPSDADLNYTEVWESANNSLNTATEIAQSFGNRFNRGNLAPLTQRYYWIRSVDFSGNKSAFVGPVNATTRQIEVGDIGPAVIQYDDFASDVTEFFDTILEDIGTIEDDIGEIVADLSDRVLVSDYNITVDYQQQLEDATNQLSEDALLLALNASELATRVNDAGITIDPATGSVVIQGLATVEDRVNNVEIDLDAVEAQLTLTATTTYVNNAIAAATLPEANLEALEDLEARVDTVEIDLNAIEGAITLTSTGSLYNVNDGVLGVEALEGRITVAQGEIELKASQTQLDDVNTRLSSAEVTINTIDAPSITIAVGEVRGISNNQDDLSELTLAEVLARYKDREYLLQDSAFARQELTADLNDQGEAISTLTTELQAQINSNVASILSEQQTRAAADSALSSNITQLQSTVVDLDDDIAGNATAISGLSTRVTNAEGNISSQASQITNLESDLATVDGKTITNATAISGLSTRVTNAEGNISSQASQITSLSTTVGNNTTTINEVATSVDGIEGKYGVTIDNNGNATGFQLLSGASGSAFNVRADQFAVFNSTGAGGDNPFTIFTSSRNIGGVVYPAGTYIEDAFIDNAAIVNGSITSAKIQDAAITNAKIGNTIQSNNFVSGSTGWRILKDGSAEFNGPVISRQLLVDSGQINFGNGDVVRRETIGRSFEHYLESTNTPISAWAGAKKTYLCNVELLGTIFARSGTPPDVYWGFTGDILPLTKWSGDQTLRLRIEFWTKNVIEYENLRANWKIYEVT
jgi:hypothetical protein